MISGKEYEDIVRQYSDMITRICILNLKNSQDAKDCFQNTFIKLFQTNVDFKSEEHLKAWLIRVCINECHHFRYLFYKPTIDIDDVIVENHKEDISIMPFVLKLPKKYKNVLYLYYYEGYHIHEISQLLNLNENTVKSHLKRGRELLRKKVGDFYE